VVLQSLQAQMFEKMMQELHDVVQWIDLVNVTQESFECSSTERMSVEAITFAIRSSLWPREGMSRVDKTRQDMQPRVEVGVCSSSSCPRKQIVWESFHKLMNQKVSQLVFNFDNFTNKCKIHNL
jgi:hypothetical protein